MSRIDELRLMTKVARLYYEQGLTQPQIAADLDLSQATISRLLKRAQQEEIVRITISAPYGTYPELEEGLQRAFHLKEAVVADCSDDSLDILRPMGAAAAYYLQTTIKEHEVVGISSWSSTLLAMVDAMHPLPRALGAQVVQILGGVGNPAAEVHAARLTTRLAHLLRGEAHFLPAPGVIGSADAREVLMQDQFVRETLAFFDQVTLALVGIGSLEPSKLLVASGNVFSQSELESLRTEGAVGDICLRFFDAGGRPVDTPLNDRVISMPLEQLRHVRRSVGIAGGANKVPAIRAALRGGWINVLVTDQTTAAALLDEAPGD